MAGRIQGTGSKSDLLSSANILIGLTYVVTNGEGVGEWLIKSGSPPDGTIINFTESCTGISSAYAEFLGNTVSNDAEDLKYIYPPREGMYYIDRYNELVFVSMNGSWVQLPLGS